MNEQTELSTEAPIFSRPLEIVRPTFSSVEGILADFTRSLAAGQVTNNGPWVAKFEGLLEDYLGVPTLVFSSGQVALMTMLRAAGITEGEVIVPSLTFAATPHAAVWNGAEPVFADVKDDMSFTIDPADVEARITDKTVAILSVDPYGIACDYEALVTIGRRHGLRVLFDSAPSFGTTVGGRRTGGFGDGQIFSFHATKAFNTMEGGCLCSNNRELIERARAIRNFGQGADGDCTIAGLNGKMTEICAIIGLQQLKSFDAAAATRRRCAKRIGDGLADIVGVRVACSPAGQEPIWLYLPVVIDPPRFGCDRNEAVNLLARRNLHVRKYYSPPCHQMSVYAAMRRQPSLPISERLAGSVLALPIYNDMTTHECDGIVETFRLLAAIRNGEHRWKAISTSSGNSGTSIQ
jgi:dTDP-4-amino-4,6-dideoxygalactose transaminase